MFLNKLRHNVCQQKARFVRFECDTQLYHKFVVTNTIRVKNMGAVYWPSLYMRQTV